MKSLLTDEERSLISQAVMDHETGNHLLYKRPDEYHLIVSEIVDALAAKQPTERQIEIKAYMKACTSPDELHKYNKKYEK